MTDRDRAFDDWVRAGKAAKVVHELARRQHFGRLKRSGAELVGPCPLCGGHDRFSVHPNRNLWNCRKCDVGGDAISLVEHLDACDFMHAVETLTGAPPPGREHNESDVDRRAREARQRAIVAAAKVADEKRAAEAADFRERERVRAREIWDRGRSIVASEAESYLRLRGLGVPSGARLRYVANQALWDAPPPSGRVVHRGPALLAGIEGADGHFGGVHITWIDLSQPNGKALVADRETGEFVPAKKIRGSKKGGSILLARPAAPARVLFIGEGIETVLSIREALAAAGADVLPIAEFRSSVDLGNLAGKAADRVPHPTHTKLDKRDKVRRVMVPGPTPRLDTDPVIPIGAAVEDIVLIGDGDSEPFATRLALERAAARFAAAYPYVTVRLAMAPDGTDFNDLWRSLPDLRGTAHPAHGEKPADEALPCPV